MQLSYEALDSAWVAAVRAGGPDANGQAPERTVSDGIGTPCRHCLADVPAGAGMLVLAARPFATLHPFAECGPIFLCAGDCTRHDGRDRPAILDSSATYLLRGYDAGGRIVYGTGGVVPSAQVEARAANLLAGAEVAHVDVRSASNNCFLLRIRSRAGEPELRVAG